MTNVKTLLVRSQSIPGFSSASWHDLSLTTRDLYPNLEHEESSRSLGQAYAMLCPEDDDAIPLDDHDTWADDASDTSHMNDTEDCTCLRCERAQRPVASMPRLKDKDWLYSNAYLSRSADKELVDFLQMPHAFGHLSVFDVSHWLKSSHDSSAAPESRRSIRGPNACANPFPATRRRLMWPCSVSSPRRHETNQGFAHCCPPSTSLRLRQRSVSTISQAHPLALP